jgi:hypothetical protein
VTERFVPVEEFTGYPDGKTPVVFKPGVLSIPVTPEFAQLMRDKGLVATGMKAQLLMAEAGGTREPKRLKPPGAAVKRKIAASTKPRRSGKAAGQSSQD